jgi:hypothetical protein
MRQKASALELELPDRCVEANRHNGVSDGSSRCGDLEMFGNPERRHGSVTDRQQHDYREYDSHRRQTVIAPAAEPVDPPGKAPPLASH